MGQNVNPKLYRIRKTEEWDSKYIEKKLPELAFISQNDLSINDFIVKFFHDNHLVVNKIKINHLIDSLQIFISYYKKTQLKPYARAHKALRNQVLQVLDSEADITAGHNNMVLKPLLRRLSRAYRRRTKLLYPLKRHKLISKTLKKGFKRKLSRLSFFKLLKLKLISENSTYKQIEDTLWTCLNKIFHRVTNLKKKTKSIHLFFQRINRDLDLRKRRKGEPDTRTKRQKRQLKYVELLRRFQNEKFFKEGLNVFAAAARNHNPTDLLVRYICAQMKKMTKHNRFLAFLRSGLRMFFGRRKDLKGLKIKIKGRFNKRPRARHRVIAFRRGITLIKATSKVYYSEGTAFGPNCTSGIKIWLEKKGRKKRARTNEQVRKMQAKRLRKLCKRAKKKLFKTKKRISNKKIVKKNFKPRFNKKMKKPLRKSV